jgi:hypothetical protein
VKHSPHPPALKAALAQLAALPRTPPGMLARLAERFDRNYNSLTSTLYYLRRDLRRQATEGAGEHPPPALGVAPSPARQAASGCKAEGVLPSGVAETAPCGVDVSSLKLDARGESRAVASAAGTVPLPPCDGVGVVPAAVFSAEEPALSPGLMWAWAMLERGVPRGKLLRTAGDRLTWRDRDQLMGRTA